MTAEKGLVAYRKYEAGSLPIFVPSVKQRGLRCRGNEYDKLKHWWFFLGSSHNFRIMFGGAIADGGRVRKMGRRQ